MRNGRALDFVIGGTKGQKRNKGKPGAPPMRTEITRADFVRLGLAVATAPLLQRVARAAAAAELAIMQTEAPRSMDPADQTATLTSGVLSPMYEGLTKFDENRQPGPSLATAWKTDDAGTNWSFDLRPGVKFHDGTPCDADAVAASFQRHLDTQRGLASSGRFRAVIADVRANGAGVVFTLKSPYPAMLRLLATANASVVSPTADKTGTLGRKAVGTGPFRFVEWASGQYVRQEANPDYWGAKPSLAALKWTWTAEPGVMNMAVHTGDADIVNPLPPAFAGQLKSQWKIGLQNHDGSAVYWVSLNTQMKPLDDVRVRQALNYATDRAALVRSLLFGYATPANSPLAPVDLFYDASLPGYPYDPDKAKALLREAGVPDGFSMNVAVQAPQSNIAEALQGMWANVGVKLDVLRMESGVWVQAAFGDPEQKAKQGLFSALASWSTGFIDPDLQFRPLYGSKNWSPTGPNLGFYKNDTLDALLDRAAATMDPAQRQPMYVQAQKIVVDDAPHVLLYIPKDLAAIRSDVQGVWMLPGGQLIVSSARRA
jgi:glutathione transport system substrate-binding protein